MDKTELSDLDIKNYYNWKDNKSKESFQTLYRGMLPLINKASQKAAYGSQVPQSVFKLEAAQQFYNALGRFDPKYGTKLSTFMHKTLENKLKRVNTTYQNIARITERGAGELGVFQINDYNNTKDMLTDVLNREPTDAEVAKEMNVTPDKVQRLRMEVRKDLSLNADLEDYATAGELDSDEEMLAMVYYDLPPEAQLLFDYSQGKHGKKAILKPNGKPDYKRIAQKISMSETKVQKLRKTIARQIPSIG